MINRSKSTLFLIEQIIAIAVFAICAVACIRIISTAYFNSRDSRDIGFAIIAAESVAEGFKSVSGDFGQVADIFKGTKTDINGEAAVFVYYDTNWQLSTDRDASFILSLSENKTTDFSSYRLVEGVVSVERISGDELISFNIASITEG